MALQSPFFGKRENEPLNTRPSTFNNTSSPLQPTVSSSAMSSSSSASSAAPTSSAAVAPTASAATQEPGSKLIVGPNIKLKGVEITDCDTLVVEGTVEATMDSRMMQIAEQGAFKGSAEVDLAEIRGAFDGDLVVREKLVVYATGKVSGKIRYGKVVIEEGGQISGEISFGAAPAKSAKPALAAA
ncbi:polymer-forming cytoskeletal protein [Pseudorhodoferax sp. Leaf274]|uniref:bactofilin family protein n=1 Tax=Pseudorhodoferax sp. Leaf274 TaxID=1736318 RepID=UPI0007029BE3|nr:polymer-forming cytoskeletal protein [Pseudorhodoferax sp. Leaf274]KQP49516.1 cell shape determination protein CcmA [Pseudorhodoferax sp. Leaf274]